MEKSCIVQGEEKSRAVDGRENPRAVEGREKSCEVEGRDVGRKVGTWGDAESRVWRAEDETI